MKFLISTSLKSKPTPNKHENLLMNGPGHPLATSSIFFFKCPIYFFFSNFVFPPLGRRPGNTKSFALKRRPKFYCLVRSCYVLLQNCARLQVSSNSNKSQNEFYFLARKSAWSFKVLSIENLKMFWVEGRVTWYFVDQPVCSIHYN